jgi:hypothetical protein
VVMPGTNPRMPTARKTIPRSIPNVLAISDLLLGEKKPALWQSQFLLAKKNRDFFRTPQFHRCLTSDYEIHSLRGVGACADC